MSATSLAQMPPQAPSRTVLMLGDGVARGGHEHATHQAIAERVAALLGLPCGGDWCEGLPSGSAYLVPRQPLSGMADAARYGIRCEDDLLGGWVPLAWMATKAIVHPLVAADAAAPAGWMQRLGEDAWDLALPGYTAFSAADAFAAGRRLLRRGPVRLKPAGADGGRGQIVVRDAAALDSALAGLCVDGVMRDILAVELNLEEVMTFSVGEVHLPGRTISYCGTQRTTPGRNGEEAYGGSALLAVRGGLAELLRAGLPQEHEDAVRLAIGFEDLLRRHVPERIVSRRNYDIARGRDQRGEWHMGILEQSWRIGGATPAELAAFEAFARNPRARKVHATCVEAHSWPDRLPPGAAVYHRGSGAGDGPLIKYAWAEEAGET